MLDMVRHVGLWLVVAVLLLGATAFTTLSSAADAPLQNGVYVLLKEAPSAEAARAEGVSHVVLLYDAAKYTGQPQERTYLALGTSSFVPLILDRPPEAQTDDRGWTMLFVTLAPQHVKTLEDFTREHVGGRVAVVLDGEVVTTHKVRSPVTGGKLQITRCQDNACEVLRGKLTN